MTDPDYEDGLAEAGSFLVDLEAEEPMRAVVKYERTVNPYKSVPDSVWQDYFLEIRRQREAKDIAVENASATVTSHEWSDDTSGWPTSPKRLAARLKAAGWQIRGQVSTTHHPEQYYTGRGEITEDGTRSHERGDVKTEAFDLTHYGIFARLDSSKKAIQAYWETRKSKTTFKEAQCNRQWFTKLKEVEEFIND